ncbi:MAG: DUF2851 family protein [Lentimicrobium sp.]
MTEAFLHYLWKNSMLKPDLQSTLGQTITIIRPGNLNEDAGPDFTESIIKIGEEIWAGNVEIHIRTSDWFKHGHDKDQAYQNIILHVVFENDMSLPAEAKFPTLELKSYIDNTLWNRYQSLLLSKDWIPCARNFHEVFPLTVHSMLENALYRRLERKVEDISKIVTINKNNLSEAFYIILARSYGLKANTQAFELLAKSLPLNLLARHKGNILQIEALLFGQAGMLSQACDEYQDKLRNEYLFLKNKYGLVPIPNQLWRFLRLRPANFPTLRISQLADLLNKSSHLLSRLTECSSISDMEELLSCKASSYWDTHYRFGEISKLKPKITGKDFIHSIIINCVIPFMHIYGVYTSKTNYLKNIESLLSELPAENNKIIRGWEEIGYKAKDAFESQALIELKTQYCNLKLCLDCRIGHALLTQK